MYMINILSNKSKILLIEKLFESTESSKFFSKKVIISGTFDSKKDSQRTKL